MTIRNSIYISNKKKTFPRWIYSLFYIFAAYMALPLIDVPLVGLSLSAPIFFFIAFYAIFKSPAGWLRTHRLWITLAILIWVGIFLSATLNGLLSGGVNFNNSGFLAILRFAYWLLVFVVTGYFAGQGDLLKKIVSLLGVITFLLGLLRWIEILIYGNFGAWSGTHFMSQNSYGFLFSTFSPFLLIFLFQFRGWKRFWSAFSLIILWAAVAINGSRGSWVSIAIGLAVLTLIFFLNKPKKIIILILSLSLLAVLTGLILVSVPQLSEAVLNRFDTFDRLEQDKSYAIRQLMNQKAIRLFTESPVVGVGPYRFRITSTELNIPSVLSYAPQSYFDSKSAHNSYLAFLAETGLLGFIPFSLLIITLLLRGFTQVRLLVRHNQYWALAIFLGFIQMSIHMWVMSTLTNTANWFFYGLMASLILYGQKNLKG